MGASTDMNKINAIIRRLSHGDFYRIEAGEFISEYTMRRAR